MNSKKVNPILVILIAAVTLVLITVLIVFLMGYRYTTLPNGAKFLGKWESGQPVSGTIKYQNGTEAEIDYYASTLTFSNGDIYEGTLNVGCREGVGVMKYFATGDVYEGDFLKDEMTGNCTYRYANGDIYVGAVVNAQKHGYGEFTAANGNKYVGYYENDVRSGEGQYTWASGASYRGSYQNDLKHGYGVMVYESGDVYEGNFKDDKRDGEDGHYVWANGEIYNGTFRNNLMDTREVDENGNFIKDNNGEYVHGKKATYSFTTGREYYGYFESNLTVAKIEITD